MNAMALSLLDSTSLSHGDHHQEESDETQSEITEYILGLADDLQATWGSYGHGRGFFPP